MSTDYRQFKRFNVIGNSGSGKTTFSGKLAEILGIPHIQMDAIFWGPNWYEPSDDEFFPRVQSALDRDAWVLDGNYIRTIPIKWAKVDCVIWLDYSFVRTVRQAVGRAVSRSISGQELWEGTGNRETCVRALRVKTLSSCIRCNRMRRHATAFSHSCRLRNTLGSSLSD